MLSNAIKKNKVKSDTLERVWSVKKSKDTTAVSSIPKKEAKIERLSEYLY